MARWRGGTVARWRGGAVGGAHGLPRAEAVGRVIPLTALTLTLTLTGGVGDPSDSAEAQRSLAQQPASLAAQQCAAPP